MIEIIIVVLILLIFTINGGAYSCIIDENNDTHNPEKLDLPEYGKRCSKKSNGEWQTKEACETYCLSLNEKNEGLIDTLIENTFDKGIIFPTPIDHIKKINDIEFMHKYRSEDGLKIVTQLNKISPKFSMDIIKKIASKVNTSLLYAYNILPNAKDEHYNLIKDRINYLEEVKGERDEYELEKLKDIKSEIEGDINVWFKKNRFLNMGGLKNFISFYKYVCKIRDTNQMTVLFIIKKEIHSNSIIIDPVSKRAIHFEPHFGTKYMYDYTAKMYKNYSEIFKMIFDRMGYEYIDTAQNSFPALQSSGESDPYCVTWTLLFSLLFILNPEKNWKESTQLFVGLEDKSRFILEEVFCSYLYYNFMEGFTKTDLIKKLHKYDDECKELENKFLLKGKQNSTRLSEIAVHIQYLIFDMFQLTKYLDRIDLAKWLIKLEEVMDYLNEIYEKYDYIINFAGVELELMGAISLIDYKQKYSEIDNERRKVCTLL